MVCTVLDIKCKHLKYGATGFLFCKVNHVFCEYGRFFSTKNISPDHWYENIMLRKVPRTKTIISVDCEECY